MSNLRETTAFKIWVGSQRKCVTRFHKYVLCMLGKNAESLAGMKLLAKPLDYKLQTAKDDGEEAIAAESLPKSGDSFSKC